MVSISLHHCVFNLITVCYHISLCISQHLPCTAESLLLSNALPICAEYAHHSAYSLKSMLIPKLDPPIKIKD